jgi:protein ImuA
LLADDTNHYPNTWAPERRKFNVQAVVGKEQLLRALSARQATVIDHRALRTGLHALDELAPGGAFRQGAVHELLWRRPAPVPTTFALLLAKAAQQSGGAVAWSDPERELYLPPLAAAGIDLRRLLLLRCAKRADQLWALAECMRCRGVSATVASIQNLSQIEARRLQLAAERGGGIGLFMRPYTPGTSAIYAAATRWLVQAAAGDDGVQRWRVELLYGHGGRTGQILLLEVDRETRALRASAPLADRPAPPAAARASA